MKRVKPLCLICLLLVSFTNAAAWAHGGGHGGGGHYGGGHYGGHYGGHFYGHGGFYGRPSVGFYFGPAFGWPYYPYPYYPYYAYPPAIVTVPSSPPVYIQQNGGQPASQGQGNYWYYCNDPQGYYPYVKECPGGWQAVPPQPPPSR